MTNQSSCYLLLLTKSVFSLTHQILISYYWAYHINLRDRSAEGIETERLNFRARNFSDLSDALNYLWASHCSSRPYYYSRDGVLWSLFNTNLKDYRSLRLETNISELFNLIFISLSKFRPIL